MRVGSTIYSRDKIPVCQGKPGANVHFCKRNITKVPQSGVILCCPYRNPLFPFQENSRKVSEEAF